MLPRRSIPTNRDLNCIPVASSCIHTLHHTGKHAPITAVDVCITHVSYKHRASNLFTVKALRFQQCICCHLPLGAAAGSRRDEAAASCRLNQNASQELGAEQLCCVVDTAAHCALAKQAVFKLQSIVCQQLHASHLLSLQLCLHCLQVSTLCGGVVHQHRGILEK